MFIYIYIHTYNIYIQSFLTPADLQASNVLSTAFRASDFLTAYLYDEGKN